MEHQLKISNGYFQLLKVFLKEQNVDLADLALNEEQRIELEKTLCAAIDQQTSYDFFMEVVAAIHRRIDCPDLAFALAKCITPANFGLLGYMASRSESLAQALEYVVRFSPLVVVGLNVTYMRYEIVNNTIRLFCPLGADKYIFLHEVTFAAMIFLAKQFVGSQHLPLIQMSFVNAPTMPLYLYQQFYQCVIKFEQPMYEIIISTDALQMKHEQADPNLIQLLVKQAEENLAQTSPHTTVVQRIRFIVAEYLKLEQQAPKIEDIAQELFVSGRTLQRQLKQYDTSFKQILEEERMQRCEVLLMQDKDLTDIALQLGYSDQSALARAYKAFSGQTLLQKKQQLKE